MARLEVCVDSLASLDAAIAGGADRVELCSALGTGGVTPSPGLLSHAVARSPVPIIALIRCQPGDFVYSRDEVAAMALDAAQCAHIGAAGVAVGVLTPSGEVDVNALRDLASAARGAGAAEVVFHRAFDLTAEPMHSLEVRPASTLARRRRGSHVTARPRCCTGSGWTGSLPLDRRTVLQLALTCSGNCRRGRSSWQRAVPTASGYSQGLASPLPTWRACWPRRASVKFMARAAFRRWSPPCAFTPHHAAPQRAQGLLCLGTRASGPPTAESPWVERTRCVGGSTPALWVASTGLTRCRSLPHPDP